jgi:Uma2 family endonuclease
MATEISKKLFTVHDYYRMVAAGILREKDRVELIRGEVVAMSPIGPAHNGAVLRASNALFSIVANRAIVSVQGAIRLDEYDEPQPDIVLLRHKDDFYTTAHAGPSDVFLIVEIADSSLSYDRSVKADLYAETGIIEYWVADIPNNCVWTYSDPQDKSYRIVQKFHRGETRTPRLLPQCPILANVLLP